LEPLQWVLAGVLGLRPRRCSELLIASGLGLGHHQRSRWAAGCCRAHFRLKVHKELTVLNKLGLHARPAAMFVKTANRFDCAVLVEKDGETVNGKSIMGLMMLAAHQGSRLQVRCDGREAALLAHELEQLFKRRFDEE
jgi:phosphocarrier protein HPr